MLQSLTHLDLSRSKEFSDSEASCISKSLQHNTAILNLNLSYTHINFSNPDTASSLSKMLQVNKSLTHLDLSGNETFSDSGPCCIFEDLQRNTALLKLTLSYCMKDLDV